MLKPYNLFLDDIRRPIHVTWIKLPIAEWTIIRNFDDFKKAIELMGVPKMVTFDHDLGSDHATGYDCAKWLVEHCDKFKIPFPKYFIHSMNPIGVKNIDSYIKSYKKTVEK
jgi:hypothetical protein|tara:strand:+ start:2356 stop:2688 length:333 start_codon:yes stop_codon:yes gene_type:complete